MNYLPLLHTLIARLEHSGFVRQSAELSDAVFGASTGSELLMHSVVTLLEWKQTAPEAFELVKKEALALQAFCHTQGLFPG
jgi:hypothetical protein